MLLPTSQVNNSTHWLPAVRRWWRPRLILKWYSFPDSYPSVAESEWKKERARKQPPRVVQSVLNIQIDYRCAKKAHTAATRHGRGREGGMCIFDLESRQKEKEYPCLLFKYITHFFFFFGPPLLLSPSPPRIFTARYLRIATIGVFPLPLYRNAHTYTHMGSYHYCTGSSPPPLPLPEEISPISISPCPFLSHLVQYSIRF